MKKISLWQGECRENAIVNVTAKVIEADALDVMLMSTFRAF